MKIITKFKDFYDSAFSSKFHDDKLVLLRDKRKVKERDLKYKLPFRSFDIGINDKYRRENSLTSINRVASVDFLYFCGKIFPVYSISDKSYINRYGRSLEECSIVKENEIYFDSFEEMLKMCEEEGIKVDEFIVLEGIGRRIFNDSKLKKTAERVKSSKNIEVPADFFREINSPYFITENIYQIEVFPELKKLTKALKKHANEVYQEIEMYVGGVLGNIEKETIEISDIDKRNSKGFDNQSFKKRKQK